MQIVAPQFAFVVVVATHAVIWREMVNGNVVWHLADRSSTYGTAVNGKRVLDTVIKHGDSIVFAGAYGGNHAVSENIGEFVNSSRLGLVDVEFLILVWGNGPTADV